MRPQPMSRLSPFAGEGEGQCKLCNKAQCPLHVLGVNFQRGWSFTVGTRLCSLSWVSPFQAKPHTKSWAFPTFHTVPGSAGPRTATQTASSSLLQARRNLCDVGLCPSHGESQQRGMLRATPAGAHHHLGNLLPVQLVQHCSALCYPSPGVSQGNFPAARLLLEEVSLVLERHQIL